MRRRHEEPAESLELVLGCMWDNFGNIILIALLVTIVARESKNDAPANARAELSQREAARAEDALALAKAVSADLSEKSSDPALAERLKLLEQRQNLRQEVERQQERIRVAAEQLAANAATSRTSVVDIVRTAQTELAARQQLLSAEHKQTDQLKLAIETQKRKLQEKQRELLAASDQRVRRLRLPREHETTKTHFYMIVRYGRLYPLYTFRDGDPERNTTSLRWIEESAGAKRIEALPEGGAVITDAATLAPFFRQFPADSLYLVFQVYEDSFAAFNTAKATAVAQRFEYTWEPRKRDEVLRLGAGARPPPPQ